MSESNKLRKFRKPKTSDFLVRTARVGKTANAASLALFAAAVRRSMDYEDAQGEPVIHVKDGKPLTEHGAKLLGVAWPADEAK